MFPCIVIQYTILEKHIFTLCNVRFYVRNSQIQSNVISQRYKHITVCLVLCCCIFYDGSWLRGGLARMKSVQSCACMEYFYMKQTQAHMSGCQVWDWNSTTYCQYRRLWGLVIVQHSSLGNQNIAKSSDCQLFTILYFTTPPVWYTCSVTSAGSSLFPLLPHTTQCVFNLCWVKMCLILPLMYMLRDCTSCKLIINVTSNRKLRKWAYSKNSAMQTPHFNRGFAQVGIAFWLTAIHYNPWNVDSPLFSKADGFCGACMHCKKV